MPLVAKSVSEIQELVRETSRLLPVGSQTKPALSTPASEEKCLVMTGISGIVEYEPSEFTITVQAGTRLAETVSLLAEHGQYLPFDPLFVERGATIGGTIAAGVSGPGRFHYGGVRDFILGVRYVNSSGELVRSGGKVVKNAAGFDFAKLMVGSLGRLGILIELSFKVFPQPECFGSLKLKSNSLEESLDQIYRLLNLPVDLDALDLAFESEGWVVWARLGGLMEAVPARLERLHNLIGAGEIISGEADELAWREARECSWAPEGWSLVKVPMTPGRITSFESALQRDQNSGLVNSQVLRRYSSAGQSAWLALQESPDCIDSLLVSQGLSGLVLLGPPGQPRLGFSSSAGFARRVKLAFDPSARFTSLF